MDVSIWAWALLSSTALFLLVPVLLPSLLKVLRCSPRRGQGCDPARDSTLASWLD